MLYQQESQLEHCKASALLILSIPTALLFVSLVGFVVGTVTTLSAKPIAIPPSTRITTTHDL